MPVSYRGPVSVQLISCNRVNGWKSAIFQVQALLYEGNIVKPVYYIYICMYVCLRVTISHSSWKYNDKYMLKETMAMVFVIECPIVPQYSRMLAGPLCFRRYHMININTLSLIEIIKVPARKKKHITMRLTVLNCHQT